MWGIWTILAKRYTWFNLFTALQCCWTLLQLVHYSTVFWGVMDERSSKFGVSMQIRRDRVRGPSMSSAMIWLRIWSSLTYKGEAQRSYFFPTSSAEKSHLAKTSISLDIMSLSMTIDQLIRTFSNRNHGTTLYGNVPAVFSSNRKEAAGAILSLTLVWNIKTTKEPRNQAIFQ